MPGQYHAAVVVGYEHSYSLRNLLGGSLATEYFVTATPINRVSSIEDS
jgi:hypothetical protein